MELEAFVTEIGIGEVLELFVFATVPAGELVDLLVVRLAVAFDGAGTDELFAVFAEDTLEFPFAEVGFASEVPSAQLIFI